MSKKIKPLKSHIERDDIVTLSSLFLIRNPVGFTPVMIAKHFRELGYACYGGTGKQPGTFYHADDLMKILEKERMASKQKGSDGRLWDANVDLAREVMRTRLLKH